jgi:hypothetical protein
MNVEQAFIKTGDKKTVTESVKLRLNSNPDPVGSQPYVGLPNSYDSILANEPKRKVAISEISNGWISILESKEVNDYKMLLDLSIALNTEVLAVVISDVTASCGFTEIINGTVENSFFSEKEDDFEGIIYKKLLDKGIDIPVCMFREIASKKIQGWQIITAK